MAEGQVVGIISIKVTPDTSGFRRELMAELQAIDKSTEGKVKVKADFDEDGLKGKVEAAAKAADSTTKVKVDVDDNSMRRKLDQLNLAFERRVSNSLEKGPLNPDSINAMQRKLDTLDLGWDKKVADFKTAPLREMEARINLRPHLDEAGLEEMRLRLAHENFTAKVKLETDRNNLERMASSAGRDFEKSLDKIFGENTQKPGLFSRLTSGFGNAGAGVKLPDLVPNIGGLGAVGSIAVIVGAASLLAPALALFSQALVSLPALLVAVAAPIGVFALGLGGIKKALDDVGILSKNKKGKQGIGDVLKNIQEPINNTFEQGFKPLFQSLVDATTNPVFTRGLQFIAQGIVNFAGGITQALTSTGNLDQLDRLTNSIGSMLTNLGPGIRTFSDTMIRLTTDVSDHLPGAANVMDKWADRFANWVAKMDQPGWVGGPSTLDKAVSNMAPILDSIVSFVGRLVDAGLQLASNPDMANNIKKVIDGITNFTLQVLPGLTKVFDTLATLFGKIQPPGDGKIPPGTVPAPGQQFAGLPPGQAPAPAPTTAPKSGGPWADKPDVDGNGRFHFDDQLPWWISPKGWGHKLTEIFERPHSDHPVIMQQGPGGQQPNQQPQQAPSPSGFQDFLKGPGSLIMPPQGVQGQQPQGTPEIGQQAQVQVDAAKQAYSQLPGAVQAAMASIATIVQGMTGTIVGAFVSMGSQIVAAINGIRGQLVAAGANLAAGLAEGITSGTAGVAAAAQNLAKAAEIASTNHLQIKSPSKLFFGIGQNTAAGFQTGIESGFDGVIQSATGLLDQLHGKFNGGMLPPGIKDNLSKELKAIGQEYDELKVQRDALDPKDKTGRKHISDQMKQLQTLRNQLKLAQDKQGGGKGKDDMDIGQMFGQQLQKLPGVGANFAMANVNQFEQDLGMSGKGAIPTIANIGLQWATSLASSQIGNAFGDQAKKQPGGDTHFHVGTADEAVTVHQAEQKRKAMSLSGR